MPDSSRVQADLNHADELGMASLFSFYNTALDLRFDGEYVVLRKQRFPAPPNKSEVWMG